MRNSLAGNSNARTPPRGDDGEDYNQGFQKDLGCEVEVLEARDDGVVHFWDFLLHPDFAIVFLRTTTQCGAQHGRGAQQHGAQHGRVLYL